MENINSESPLSPEQELALAQQRLAEARRRIDLLEEAKLQKLRQDIADRVAEEDQRLFEQAEERKLTEQKWLDKKRAEAEERERERRTQQTAQRQREQAVAEAEEAQRLRREHVHEVERLANEAYLLEQEARRREAELYASNTAFHSSEDSAEAISGRDLLFGRLTRPAIRFDGHDGHIESPVAIAPCTATGNEEKQ